jgi:putative ABC transport system ATP-binding protein
MRWKRSKALESTKPALPVPDWSGAPKAAAFLRWVLSQQWRLIIAGATAGVLWMGARAAVPGVLGAIVDHAVSVADSTVETGVLALWATALLGLGVIEVGSGAVRHWSAVRLSNQTQVIIADVVTKKVHDRRGGAAEQNAPGALVSIATSDAKRIGVVADRCCRGTGAAVTVAAVAVVLFATSPLLGLIIVAGLPTLILLMSPLWRPLERTAFTEQRRMSDITAAIADLITGIRVIKGIGAEPAAMDRFRDGNARLRDSAVGVARLNAAWTAASNAVPALAVAVLAWAGGQLVIDARLSAGELVAVFGYAMFLVQPLTVLGELGMVWKRGIASAGRVVELLGAPPLVADDRPGPAAPPGTPMGVRLAGVTSVDGALREADIDVPAGSVTAVAPLDHRAAAALMRLLERSGDPAAGQVTVGGTPLPDLPLRTVRRLLLCAEPDPFLFEASLADNLRYGLDGRDGAEDVSQAVRRAGAIAQVGEIVDRLPEGAQSLVGERGHMLSGGQRQRVGLARALAAAPPVLVLFDPTSAVDVHTERAITEALGRARRGRSTTLLVTTSPALLASADRVFVLSGGRVSGNGTHRDLLRRHPGYRRATSPEPAEPPGPAAPPIAEAR